MKAMFDLGHPPMPPVKRYRTTVWWRERAYPSLKVDSGPVSSRDRFVSMTDIKGTVQLIPLDQVFRIEQEPIDG